MPGLLTSLLPLKFQYLYTVHKDCPQRGAIFCLCTLQKMGCRHMQANWGGRRLQGTCSRTSRRTSRSKSRLEEVRRGRRGAAAAAAAGTTAAGLLKCEHRAIHMRMSSDHKAHNTSSW